MSKLPFEIITNPVRSTLFGKFYEEIFRGWFKKQGFTVFSGKPRVYWDNQPTPENEDNRTIMTNLINELEEKKTQNYFCTPDGFLKRDEKYYIWEAKNWPLWTLDSMSDVLYSSPWLLTKYATYRTIKYKISGIIFTWWSIPDNEKEIIDNISSCISPNTFDVFYTKNILHKCVAAQPEWYIDIVKFYQKDILSFFKELLGENNHHISS